MYLRHSLRYHKYSRTKYNHKADTTKYPKISQLHSLNCYNKLRGGKEREERRKRRDVKFEARIRLEEKEREEESCRNKCGDETRCSKHQLVNRIKQIWGCGKQNKYFLTFLFTLRNLKLGSLIVSPEKKLDHLYA